MQLRLVRAMAAGVLVLGLQAGAAGPPPEQELEVLQPPAGQEIRVEGVAGEQQVQSVAGTAAQEVGGLEPRSVAEKRASTAAKFGVAVLGGVVALGTTVAMLLFL